MSDMEHHDVIVIGLGAVGSQALRVLARRGHRVLGLERFGRAHDRGSSHGHTRVTRHAYFEHPDYVPLLRVSTDAFRALEGATGTALLEACGVLLLGPPGSPVVEASAEAAARWGVAVEELGAGQLRERFPAFAVDEHDVGLWEPGGGFVRPEASILAALQDAEAHGARVRTGCTVFGIEESRGGVEVSIDGAVLRAGAVVVAAGAWTARLLPELSGVLRVTRQVQAWIRPDDPASAAPDTLPCWLIDRGPEPPLYGIPVDPLRPGPPLAKVAVHGSSRTVEPDHLHRSVGADERVGLAWLAERFVPGLSGRLVSARTCLYTQTPDEHFIIDRAPGSRRVVLAAGLSGHGFKLSPALGQAVAELAVDGRTDLPVGFLGLARLRA